MKIQIKENNEESCFKKNRKILLISLISGIILIVVLIVVLVVVLQKKEKDNININITNTCNDKCLLCRNTTTFSNCLKCKDEFDLYNGECIQYAFIASHSNSHKNALIQIFNPEKIKNLFAIKIDDNIINPNSEYKFKNSKNYKIYFYFREEDNISLANMFENITSLIDFSFNSKYIYNNIINMESLFLGCTSLKSIKFSYFNSSNIEYMDKLFYNCSSLINIEISDLNTEKLINVSSMFYNCY